MSPTCDTSVIVPALTPWHPDHTGCVAAVRDVRRVPAHAIVETFSVLTRLPPPHRISPADAAAVVAALPWQLLAFPAEQHVPLVQECARHAIGGGAAHDALIAATAREHGLLLLSRDRRAVGTYEKLGVAHALV